MSRRADPTRIRRHLKTTRKGSPDSATYRVTYGGEATDWTITRNDNELEACGNPSLAWCLTYSERGVLAEKGRLGDCLDDLAKRLANLKPIFGGNP